MTKLRILKKHISFVTNHMPFYLYMGTKLQNGVYKNKSKYYHYCIAQNDKYRKELDHGGKLFKYLEDYYDGINNKTTKFNPHVYKLSVGCNIIKA